MKIRSAVLADSPAIARVHIQSWREAYAGLISDSYLNNLSLPEREKAWAENLAPDYSGGRFNLVAEDETNGIVGFASGGPLRREWGGSMRLPESLNNYCDGEIYAIYLLKSHQHQGIGKSLYQGVLEQLKQKGFHSMLVWVLKDNAPARGFYKAMGGRKIGEAKIVIERELDQLAYGWESL